VKGGSVSKFCQISAIGSRSAKRDAQRPRQSQENLFPGSVPNTGQRKKAIAKQHLRKVLDFKGLNEEPGAMRRGHERPPSQKGRGLIEEKFAERQSKGQKETANSKMT